MSKSNLPTPIEHLLDSSVVRPMLLGTRAYQQYFATQFQDQACYISPYIQMEMYRSYLRNVIEFYFTLRLTTIESFSDALTFWSNRYQGSKHKAVQQLVAQLISERFSAIDLYRKESAIQAIEVLIDEFAETIQNQFRQITTDSTQCARASIQFEVDWKGRTQIPDNRSLKMAEFVAEFDDVSTCRSRCRIHDFLLTDHRTSLDTYIKQAEELSKNDVSRGFLTIANTLKTILERGESACSCKCCERIGDVIIALDAPRHLQLEHTDQAFDYLCPPIGQPHRKHPSETKIIQESK
jgi:hypothetical protein